MNGKEALTVDNLINILKGISEAGCGDCIVIHSNNSILSVDIVESVDEKLVRLRGVEPE